MNKKTYLVIIDRLLKTMPVFDIEFWDRYDELFVYQDESRPYNYSTGPP